jgi:hypothetical protein
MIYTPKDLLEHPRLPGKTVFFLGSGFSRPLGIPVMADFIPEGLLLLKTSGWLRGGRQTALKDRKLLKHMLSILHDYEIRITQLPNGKASLEDIFCFVDLFSNYKPEGKKDRIALLKFIGRVCTLAWQRYEKEWNDCHNAEESKKTQPPHAPIVEFRHFLSDQGGTCPITNDKCKYCGHFIEENKRCGWLGPRCNEANNVCLYEAFLSQVMFANKKPLTPANFPPEYGVNAIITLNYDLIIEQIAKRMGLQVYYGDGVLGKNIIMSNQTKKVIALNSNGCKIRRCLPFMKLHGSLNWQRPINKPDAALSRCTMSEYSDDTMPLILPTWQRDPVREGRNARLLEIARVHLRLASRIVFIGYSMPLSDMYLHYLLIDALGTTILPTIEICNLSWSLDKAKMEFERFAGVRAANCVTNVYNGLDEYVRTSATPYSLI